jgi:hypothetical protein
MMVGTYRPIPKTLLTPPCTLHQHVLSVVVGLLIIDRRVQSNHRSRDRATRLQMVSKRLPLKA